MSKNCLLPLPKNAVETIRKSYNLHEPGRMEEAIIILEKWIKQENHILKKDFRREYLERVLIVSKGSLEKAKKRIDSLCTMRTLTPRFFTIKHTKAEFSEVINEVNVVPLPLLTEDLYRIVIIKIRKSTFTSHQLFLLLQYCILISEYICKNDYVNGYIFVDDFRDLNIFEFAKQLNLVDLQQFMSIVLKGYGARFKGLHIVSQSKVTDLFTNIVKQIISPKLTDRIYVYKNFEELFNKNLPKDNFPNEYGGKERSLNAIQRDWTETAFSKEHMEMFKLMSAARTDETLRTSGNFNEEYMGIPGSFRHIRVD